MNAVAPRTAADVQPWVLEEGWLDVRPMNAVAPKTAAAVQPLGLKRWVVHYGQSVSFLALLKVGTGEENDLGRGGPHPVHLAEASAS
mmetsp:Transcript_32083/g.50411  ORF Transcript_32083/g.50411 Transcript_32083/m.50411 type:complete len:87 (-) Transcript_32083:840-1100(-)